MPAPYRRYRDAPPGALLPFTVPAKKHGVLSRVTTLPGISGLPFFRRSREAGRCIADNAIRAIAAGEMDATDAWVAICIWMRNDPKSDPVLSSFITTLAERAAAPPKLTVHLHSEPENTHAA